jgi:hypothetical protein
LFRLLDTADPNPQDSAEVLDANNGAATANIPAAAGPRVLAIATDQGGFEATVDGVGQPAGAESGQRGSAAEGEVYGTWGDTFTVTSDAGELHAAHENGRPGWLLLELLVVVVSLVLAAPGLRRRAGIAEVTQ